MVFFSIAVVLCDVASEPASGSDKQKAPICSPDVSLGKYFAFVLQYHIFQFPTTSEFYGHYN